MDGQQAFNRFVFDDDEIIHQRVNAIAHVYFLALVNERQCHLRQDFSAALPQFISVTILVRRFEQSRPQRFMDFDGGIHYIFRNLLDIGQALLLREFNLLFAFFVPSRLNYAVR